MTTRCALAPVPPSGQISSECLFAGGRRRRRSRGRVRAWRSSRERVADASSRHLAVSPSCSLAVLPSRLLVVSAVTHAPLLMFPYSYFVRRYVGFHFSFSLYDILVLLYLYYFRRIHFAWPRESSHFRRIIHVFVARPRPLLSSHSYVC